MSLTHSAGAAAAAAATATVATAATAATAALSTGMFSGSRGGKQQETAKVCAKSEFFRWKEIVHRVYDMYGETCQIKQTRKLSTAHDDKHKRKKFSKHRCDHYIRAFKVKLEQVFLQKFPDFSSSLNPHS